MRRISLNSVLFAALLLPATAHATGTTEPPPPPEAGENCALIWPTADAYIWAASPFLNYGSESGLYTGLRWIGETQTLVQFDVDGVVPDGNVLQSATFQVFVMTTVDGTVVRAHDVLAPWDEDTVTWNNFGGYDSEIAGSMSTASWMFNALDVTGLAEGWLSGQANNGFLLEQDLDSKTTMASTETTIEYKLPFMEVCWQPAPPATGCIGDTVWLDADADGVYDADESPISGVVVDLYGPDGYVDSMVTDAGGGYLFCQLPAGSYDVVLSSSNFVDGGVLDGLLQTYDYDGLLDGMTSYDLADGEEFLDADFGYLPVSNPGTGTPGYWKNHPDAWPVTSLTVSGVTYQQSQLISLLGTPKKGDKTYIMAQALIAAMLNVLAGNDASCIIGDIEAGNEWLIANPIGTGGNDDWTTVGQPIQQRLDDYNNGLLCAPHRG